LKPEDTNDKGKTEVSDTYVRFIDILFAIVLGQSFSLLTSEEGFKTWLNQPIDNAFEIATILLVYTLVITSWVGYHLSVRVYAINSVWRFIIDISLLFLYYFAFVNSDKFEVVMLIFFLSFLLYAIWDLVRIIEYWSRPFKGELWKRFGYSIVFAIISFITYWLYGYLCTKITQIGWAFFISTLVLLIAYRILKWYKDPISKT
jgi:hypothetical protein